MKVGEEEGASSRCSRCGGSGSGRPEGVMHGRVQANMGCNSLENISGAVLTVCTAVARQAADNVTPLGPSL